MYIRTKEGIYEVREDIYIEDNILYQIGYDFGRLCLGEVLKQSDNLADLCDEFVYCYKNDMPILVYEEQIKQLILLGRIQDVRGAIWTDKGLIYVAKMNENGELVLI